jgi:glycosyltransferase involved in cell wall biosynthesis
MSTDLVVDVVIPVHNGAATIERCVRAVLAQSRLPAHVIVVDNGSTDATAEVAERAGAMVVHEHRPGSYAARNAGIAASTADAIAFTDDDCTPDPGWLEALVGALEAGVDVVGGEVVAPAGHTPAERWGHERGMLSQAGSFAHPFLPCFATANVLWRRTALDRIGGFDDQLQSGGDVDAHWRLQKLGGTLAFAPDAIVVHSHRRSLRQLVRQQHRYGIGHGRLDTRWAADPAYAATTGTAGQRLRAAWLLPVRIPVRLIRRDDAWLPIVDATVRVARELGRRQGRRRPPLASRPGASGSGHTTAAPTPSSHVAPAVPETGAVRS